jgi:hypothetical protein
MTEATPATKFREMADRIDHNVDSRFAGAVVIIPPTAEQGGYGGDPIEILMLDPSGNPAQFWSTLKTRVEITLAELQERERAQTGFGRR